MIRDRIFCVTLYDDDDVQYMRMQDQTLMAATI
jgi:hypothetical protein